MVAPERDRSGASNSLTLDRPLMVRKAANGFLFVNGTPTDCVHLAVTGLLDRLPDMVVSGINLGANMGDDTIYSGTVAAATEGYLLGIPALAVSLTSKAGRHFDTAAAIALDLVERHARAPAGRWLLNVNVPDRPREAILGTRITRLGRRHKAEDVIPTQNPRGETVYWVGAAGPAADAGEGTDFHATEAGLHLDHAAADRPHASRADARGGGLAAAMTRAARASRARRRSMTHPLDGIGMTSTRTRVRMIERLREQGIRDEVVLAAMNAVPRHIFVDEALAIRAYEDTPLPIGSGQTISQPWVVARMSELARNGRELDSVLEIGTGCGYQTAVLAQFAKTVYTVERIGALVAKARRNLQRLKIAQRAPQARRRQRRPRRGARGGCDRRHGRRHPRALGAAQVPEAGRADGAAARELRGPRGAAAHRARRHALGTQGADARCGKIRAAAPRPRLAHHRRGRAASPACR